MEQPPQVALGDYATPVAFELARPLRRSPKQIAAELLESLNSQPLAGFASFEVAGAGYLNARLDRGAALTAIAKAQDDVDFGAGVHSLVEHTSINPNKAAHIGHLRNAILGDTFVRLLRAAGQRGRMCRTTSTTPACRWRMWWSAWCTSKNLSQEQIATLFRELASAQRAPRLLLLGSLCAGVGSGTTLWMTRKKRRIVAPCAWARCTRSRRAETRLPQRQILISTAVLRRHLETMERLDIEYDFLPRESEILHLHFWERPSRS